MSGIFNVMLNLDLILAGCTFIVLVSTTFMGVIMRYIVNKPFIWLEEVQLASFVLIVFLSSGAAFRAGSHVAIEFIVDRFSRSIRILAEILISIIVVGVLCYFTKEGLRLAVQMARTNRVTNILNIPYSIIYGVFPMGCVLMLVNYCAVLALDVITLHRSVKNDVEKESEGHKCEYVYKQ